MALPRRQPPTETSPDHPTEPPIGRDLPFRRGEERNGERCHRFPWWRRATDREAVVSHRRRQPPTETQPWRRTDPSVASDFAFRRSEERRRDREMKEKRKCEGREGHLFSNLYPCDTWQRSNDASRAKLSNTFSLFFLLSFILIAINLKQLT